MVTVLSYSFGIDRDETDVPSISPKICKGLLTHEVCKELQLLEDPTYLILPLSSNINKKNSQIIEFGEERLSICETAEWPRLSTIYLIIKESRVGNTMMDKAYY